MAIQILKFDGRGLLHCRLTLEQYLPGIDPGLTALDSSHGLLAEATITALDRAYGSAGKDAILSRAGVLSSEPLTQGEALARVAARDPNLLPVRPTAAVSLSWHLDEVVRSETPQKTPQKTPHTSCAALRLPATP